MNTLLETLLNGGYISPQFVNNYEKVFPNLTVTIKWCDSMRETTTLGSVNECMKQGAKRGDCVREAFIPAFCHAALCKAFGITDEDQAKYYQDNPTI